MVGSLPSGFQLRNRIKIVSLVELGKGPGSVEEEDTSTTGCRVRKADDVLNMKVKFALAFGASEAAVHFIGRLPGLLQFGDAEMGVAPSWTSKNRFIELAVTLAL